MQYALLFRRIRTSITALFSTSPYKTVTAPRRTEAHGDQLPESPAVHFVSRHGFQERGVSCPACGRLAARPGEWDKLHISDRHGEGVACACGAMSFAAPDDDVDPVKPGEHYDESIYHRFARPDGWTPKRHRVLTRPVCPGDWVTIRSASAVIMATPDATEGPVVDLDGGEARVEEFTDTGALVALAGNTGIGGSREIGGSWARLPISSMHVMASQSLSKGDRVRLLRGPAQGQSGVISGMARGVIAVTTDDGVTYQCNIEIIEKTEATILI